MPLDVRSDRPEVTRALQEIARLCDAHGGSLYPHLSVLESGGQFRVVAPLRSSGKLFALPEALFIPTEGADWRTAGGAIELTHAPIDATTLQRDLLQLHIALFNAAGSAQWWIHDHPARLLEQQMAVAEAVAHVKPHFGWAAARATPVQDFWAVRSFNWKIDGAPDERKLIVFPLANLVSFHHGAPRFDVADGCMTLGIAQPDGTGECFADYGRRRDPLDLALYQGIADTSTPFAHCAPTTVHCDGVGAIKVQLQNLRSPAHPLDPPLVSIDRDGLTISHLCCDASHPQRARLMLRLALQGSLKRRGHSDSDAERLSEKAIQHLGAANELLLTRIADAVDAVTEPGHHILAQAARRQAVIIRQVLLP